MALIFRLERAKKNPRVTVLRERKESGKRLVPEHLGSFGKGRPFDHAKSKLTDSELYELQNFVGAMDFGDECFGCPVSELDRFLFKAPPKLKEALY